LDRLLIITHLWPGISPHGDQVPTSVWNLPYGVWLMYAADADEYVKSSKGASHG
jgi:hypothetical protein